MRIAHISDFHYTRLTWNPIRLVSKRLLGNLNWALARHDIFSEGVAEDLLPVLKKLKIDLILLGGDFTTTSLETEFDVAKHFVKRLPAPWLAIPGNHDAYTYRSYRQKRFYRYFSNERDTISQASDFFTLRNHQIEAHSIGGGYWIAALDVARATNLYSSRGFFSKKLEARMKEVLGLIPKEDSILVFSHYPFFQNDVHRHSLERGDALQKILEQDPRIRAFLHGHTHRHTIADLQPSNLPLILDSGSCAQTNRASWNLIDLKPNGCTVSGYRWDGGWHVGKQLDVVWTR